MRSNFLAIIFVFLWGCGSEPIPEPEPTQLIAPANLNECTTASVLNELERQVRFEWTIALNTDSYELVVENALTNKKYGKSSSLLTESLILPSGAPYRWYVNSESLLSSAIAKSDVWQFYLEGTPNSSFIPFPAVLSQPDHQSIVELDAEGKVSFLWEGHDLDQDIDRYDLYLGTDEENLILNKEGLTASQVLISLDSGTTYFWQVFTFDLEANVSKSEVFSFQTAE